MILCLVFLSSFKSFHNFSYKFVIMLYDIYFVNKFIHFENIGTQTFFHYLCEDIMIAEASISFKSLHPPPHLCVHQVIHHMWGEDNFWCDYGKLLINTPPNSLVLYCAYDMKWIYEYRYSYVLSCTLIAQILSLFLSNYDSSFM